MKNSMIELTSKDVECVSGGTDEIINAVFGFVQGFCSVALVPMTIIGGLAVVNNYVRNHPELQKIKTQ